jgi:tetratricopeptide repeat protein
MDEETQTRFMKLISRALLLADGAARFLMTHWLLIVGSVLIFAGAVLKWIYFAFSHHPVGYELPLLAKLGQIPHFSILSYGVVGVALLALVLFFIWRSATYLALSAVAVLIALWIAAPCQIAFRQPVLLKRLVVEAQELSIVRDFSKTYLPTDYGPTEEYPRKFELNALWDRFLAAYSFFGLGWYCFGVGSLLIAIYPIARLSAKERMTALMVGAIPVGVVIILSMPSLIGQYYFTRACVAQAQGAKENAIALYRRAMWFDRWRSEDISTYAAIGDLQRLSPSSKDSPEMHISKAREFKEATQYDLAVFELARAAEWGGAVAAVAKRESARTRVEFGTALYRGGGVGAAVTQWQQALSEDPLQQHEISFLIGRGNYDLGRYQAALDMLEEVLRVSADRPTRANAYSIVGDCYARLGRDAEARSSYNRSLKEQMLVNFWAMSRLTGN